MKLLILQRLCVEIMSVFTYMVFAYLFCVSGNTLPIAADRNIAEETHMVQEKGLFDVWGGIYCFQPYKSSTHPLTHLLHNTEILCCSELVEKKCPGEKRFKCHSFVSVTFLHQSLEPASIL